MVRQQFLAHFITFILFVDISLAIDCYQCSSTNNKNSFQCAEALGKDHNLIAEPCDAVYGAKYCIKHTGRFEALSIDCYQCTSAKQLECADGMIHFGGMVPENCSHVFEAQYCIKSISFGGGIGTKRFCSSLDLGNYCDYIKQPGDILTYRTCIHTCLGSGCNSSGQNVPIVFLTVFSIIIVCALKVFPE